MAEQEKKILLNVDIKNSEAIKAIAELKTQVSALKSEQNKLDTSTEAGRQKFEILGQQIKALNTESRTYEKQIQSNIKAQNEEADSIQGLKAKLSLQTAEYNKLSKARRESAEGTNMQKSIKDTSDALKLLEGNLGNNARTVGDYKNQIIAAEKSIGGMKSQLSDLQRKLETLDINSEEFKTTKKTIDNLSLAVDQAAGKVDEFGNKEPKNIAKKNFEDTITTVAILGSAISTMSTAMDENGMSSEAMAKAVKGVEIALVAANIAKESGAIIDTVVLTKEKALALSKTVLTGVTRIFGVTSAQAWALATLGLSILITGVVLLIGNFDKVISGFKSFFGIAQDFSKVNASIKATNKTLSDFAEQTKINEDRLKAQGKTDIEIWKYKKQRYAEELALNKKRYSDLKNAGRALSDDEKQQLSDSAKFISQSAKTKYQIETERINITNKLSSEALELEKKNHEKSVAANKAALDKKISNLKAEIALFRNKQSTLEETKLIEQDYFDSRVKTETDAYKKTLEIIELEKKAKTISATEAKSKQIEAEKTKNDAILALTDQRISQFISKNKYESDLTRLKNDEEIANHNQTSKQIYLNTLMQIENDRKLAIQEQDLKLSADKNYQIEHDRQIALITQQSKTATAQAKKAFDESERQRVIEAKRNDLDNELAAVRNNIDLEFKLNSDKREQERQAEILAAKTTGASVELINAKYRQLEIDADTEKFKKKFEAIKQYADSVSGILSGANELSKQIEAGQLQDAEDANAKKIADLDERLKKGSISQKEHDKQVAASAAELDKKKAKIARDQAIRDKELSLFSAIVNTASAIVEALPNIPLSILAGVTGAIEIGTILATPLPKASKGMLLKGKSHAAGGIPIEAEGGEAIINKKSTAMYGDLLSAINVAGGGIAFSSTPRFINDGGYTARSASNGSGVTEDQIQRAMEKAVAKIKVVTTIEDFRKADDNYTDVQARGTF